MHAKGSPKIMQDAQSYQNIVEEILSFFNQKKEDLSERKLPRIWIDPGIGFGKSLEHNIKIMRNLREFKDDAWNVARLIPKIMD